MDAHVCYHCKQFVEKDEPHDCWTTTEAALTRELSEDLREAWERLREAAAEFGEQRIYASHHCIMFSRKACYFFVRPKRSALEVVFFLGRTLKVPEVRRTEASSRTKVAHILHVTHRDEVEAPMTDWLREAYEMSDALSVKAAKPSPARRSKPAKKRWTARPKPSPRTTTTGRTARAGQARQRRPRTRR
jgi:Domain of unknown function (DUF5655)